MLRQIENALKGPDETLLPTGNPRKDEMINITVKPYTDEVFAKATGGVITIEKVSDAVQVESLKLSEDQARKLVRELAKKLNIYIEEKA